MKRGALPTRLNECAILKRAVSADKMFEQFDIHPIINAVGYATRVSGSCPHPQVIAAMNAASAQYFEIDDLLTAASTLIQQWTGAESGIVTCGAGAALTLAAAACLAANRPEIMDQLPDVSACPRNEIIFPVPGPFDYDHAIRLSGAKLVLVDYRAVDALRQIEQAINPRTAAIGFVWLRVDERPDLTGAGRPSSPTRTAFDRRCGLCLAANGEPHSVQPLWSGSGGVQRRKASRRASGFRNPVWSSRSHSQCLGSDGGHGCPRGHVVAAALD